MTLYVHACAAVTENNAANNAAADKICVRMNASLMTATRPAPKMFVPRLACISETLRVGLIQRMLTLSG
jgi:hypothetical protein